MDFVNPMTRDIRFPVTNQVCRASAVDGDVVYFGGGFTTAGGAPRYRLAAASITTGELLPWAPDLSIFAFYTFYAVSEMLVHGDWVYVAIAANSSGRVFRADKTTGAIDTTWGYVIATEGSTGLLISKLLIDGTSLWVCGNPKIINDKDNNFLANRKAVFAVDTASMTVLPFDAGLSTLLVPGYNLPFVLDMCFVGDTLYLAGIFPYVNETSPRSGCAAVDRFTGVALPWAPQLQGDPSAKGVTYNSEADTVIIFGPFTAVAGDGTKKYMVAVDPVTATVNNVFSPGVSGGPPGTLLPNLIYHQGYVFFAGGYTSTPTLVDGEDRGVFILDATTGALQPTGLPSSFTSANRVVAMSIAGRMLFLGSFHPPWTGPPAPQPSQTDKFSAWYFSPPVPGGFFTPQPPKIDFLHRKDGRTLLKWQKVFRDVFLNRVYVDGYKIYRSIDTKMEYYELVATVTTTNASDQRDTMFTESIPGFYGYAVSAFIDDLESEKTYVKAVSSDFDSDLPRA